MMSNAAGTLIAALLAFGFAAVGETALWRRSSDLVSWNESFLTGMGVCAAALFPLSLLFPHSALWAEFGLLGTGVLATAVRRFGSAPASRPKPPTANDPVAPFLLAAAAAVTACFAALDFKYNLFWDGLLIWASKAQVLFHEGALGRPWYPDDAYELRHLLYPPLVPLYEAVLATLRGHFDFDSVKPVFLPFYVSMLIATYGAARAVVSQRMAMAAALLLALVPPLTTAHAAGGYADMPQAAFVAGAVCAGLRPEGRGKALPWLIGSLTVVKSEGTVLAVIACAAVAAVWFLEREPGQRFRLGARWKGIAVVAAFLALRIAYTRWLAVPDSVFALDAAHLSEAVRRIPFVARACLVKALSPRRWGLLWPAFGLAGIVLFSRGTAREKGLVAATACAAAVLATVFLFTTWPLQIHIDQAYPRLLEQLAPVAVVCMVIAFHRARADAAA